MLLVCVQVTLVGNLINGANDAFVIWNKTILQLSGKDPRAVS